MFLTVPWEEQGRQVPRTEGLPSPSDVTVLSADSRPGGRASLPLQGIAHWPPAAATRLLPVGPAQEPAVLLSLWRWAELKLGRRRNEGLLCPPSTLRLTHRKRGHGVPFTYSSEGRPLALRGVEPAGGGPQGERSRRAWVTRTDPAHVLVLSSSGTTFVHCPMSSSPWSQSSRVHVHFP